MLPAKRLTLPIKEEEMASLLVRIQQLLPRPQWPGVQQGCSGKTHLKTLLQDLLHICRKRSQKPLTWLRGDDILLRCRSMQSYPFRSAPVPGAGNCSLEGAENAFCFATGSGFRLAPLLCSNAGWRGYLPESAGKLGERARTSQVNHWLALPDYRLGFRSATFE